MAAKRLRRILIVDDEPVVREYLQRFFSGKGYQVAAAADAESALARAKKERFDGVILDNSLPGMMGLTVLPQLVELTQGAIIMISGYPNPETHRDAILLGAKSFLAKPVRAEDLEAKLLGFVESGP